MTFIVSFFLTVEKHQLVLDTTPFNSKTNKSAWDEQDTEIDGVPGKHLENQHAKRPKVCCLVMTLSRNPSKYPNVSKLVSTVSVAVSRPSAGQIRHCIENLRISPLSCNI